MSNQYVEEIENKCAMYSSLLNTETPRIVIFDNDGSIIDQNEYFKSTWQINNGLSGKNNPNSIKDHLKNQVVILGEYINHSCESLTDVNI